MPSAAANPDAAVRPPAAPLFAAVVAFGAGILLQIYLYKPAALYLFAIVGFALCAASALRWTRDRARTRIAYVAAVLAFFPAGALVMAAHQSEPQPEATVLNFASGDEVTLTGYVARSGSMRNGGCETRETLDMAVEQAAWDDQPAQPASGTVRLSLYVPGHFTWEASDGLSDSETSAEVSVETNSAAPPALVYGQRLRLRAKLRPPVNYRNPGNMDYVGWLREQGIVALGSARSTELEMLPGVGGSRWNRMRWHACGVVLDRIGRLWPAPYAGLFQAMVLGERGLVSREQRLEFQRSGTFHLLVVSGMNVAVFAIFLVWLAGRLRVRAEYATVAVIFLTCGYAWLTELGVPILRSVLMIVAYQVGVLLNRDRSPLNTVALAALIVLLLNPSDLMTASFQLTFLAVMTLAGIASPLFARTSSPVRQALDDVGDLGRDITLRPWQAQLRLDLRAVITSLGKLISLPAARWLVPATLRTGLAMAELFALSALMQAAITLPTVWYFHRINVHSLWANMAVLPLMSLLMPASMLAVAASFASHWLAAPFALAAQWALRGILLTVHWSGGAQLPEMRVAMPAPWTIAAAATAYAVALLLARRHRLLTAAGLAVLAASAWMVFAYPRPFQYRSGELEITAIDIGQGDSFLLVTPHGHTLLLDSGGLLGMSYSELDIGEDVVSPYLWQRGLSHLDVAAFTHGHADHMGGMAAILRNFHPRELWSAANYRSPEVESLYATADRLGIRRVMRQDGEHFDFDGVSFDVLSPPLDWELKPHGQDDASMVLRVRYAGHTALLVGDIHKKMEKLLVQDAEEHHTRLASDLLKVAHHGSNTSSCDEFLDAVAPEYAVISAGVRNPFRHPRPEVIERLAERHIRTYRTDLFGPITFYLDAEGVHPQVAR